MDDHTPSPGSRRRPQGLNLWLVVAIAATLAWLYWRADRPPSCAGPPPLTNTPEAAAAFSGTTLDGQTLRFPEDFRGKLVLLDFWATWCPPCRAELPNLKTARQVFDTDDLAIVGVSLDEVRNVDAAHVRRFVSANGMHWPVIYDGARRIAGLYGIESIPSAFLIDADSRRILAQGDELRGDRLLETLVRCVTTGSGYPDRTGKSP